MPISPALPSNLADSDSIGAATWNRLATFVNTLEALPTSVGTQSALGLSTVSVNLTAFRQTIVRVNQSSVIMTLSTPDPGRWNTIRDQRIIILVNDATSTTSTISFSNASPSTQNVVLTAGQSTMLVVEWIGGTIGWAFIASSTPFLAKP